MEEPQRRIDRIVFRRLALFGEAIRQHALAGVRGKGAQDGGYLGVGVVVEETVDLGDDVG